MNNVKTHKLYIYNAVIFATVTKDLSQKLFSKEQKFILLIEDDIHFIHAPRKPTSSVTSTSWHMCTVLADIHCNIHAVPQNDDIKCKPPVSKSSDARWEQSIAQNSATHPGLFLSLVALKFKIARVKRRKTIKKMAENGATLTAPCLFTSYTAHLSIRYTRAFKEEISNFYSKHFSKPLILDKVYQTDVENALVLLVIRMKS